MTRYCSIYATFGNADQARRIGRSLVDEGLVACVNVFPEISSIYRWEGKVEEDAEAAFIAKTRGDLAAQAIARIVQLHSYACPCVVAWPIEEGHAPYLDWISLNTQPNF